MEVNGITKIRARSAGRGAQRGLTLVTVLWVLMLLALIAASFTRTTRTETDRVRKCPGWA